MRLPFSAHCSVFFAAIYMYTIRLGLVPGVRFPLRFRHECGMRNTECGVTNDQ